MESLLKQASNKGETDPPFIVVYGQDKIGKSTWAASAPSPIFIGPEAERGVKRIKNAIAVPGLNTYDKNLQVLKEIQENPMDYKTVVFESADWLEKIAEEKVLSEDRNASSIVTALGGYNAGFKRSEQLQADIIDLLERIRTENQMNVIVTGHYALVRSKDPNTDADFVRYQIKLREKTAAYWREIVDGIFFAHYEISNGKKDARAFSDGTRLLGCNWKAAYDAGNCFGIKEPFKMEETEGFSKFLEIIKVSERDEIEETKNEIESLRIKLSGDKARLKKLDERTETAIKSKDVATLKKIAAQLKVMDAA